MRRAWTRRSRAGTSTRAGSLHLCLSLAAVLPALVLAWLPLSEAAEPWAYGMALLLLVAAPLHVRAWVRLRESDGLDGVFTRRRDGLLAEMGYAIRSPMNAIIGMTDLVLDGPLARDQKNALESVRASAESLLALLSNFLDYARLRNGHLELEAAPFDLRDTVYAAVRSVAPRAHAKGLELLWQVAAEVPEQIVGDAQRLQQILYNLLDNAVTFTDEGEIVVRIRREAGSDEAVVLSFDVEDTGIGIASARRRSLFHVFQGKPESASGGVGLGLAVAARLVRRMRGEIELRSEPGRGSRFRFRARFGCAPAAGCAPRADLRGVRILLIDDNAAARRVLMGMLRALCGIPAAVGTPAEALATLREARTEGRAYAVVVIDMALPDRAALVEKIRSDASLGGPAIVGAVVAGPDEPADDGDGIAARVAKPVRPQEMLVAVKRALAHAQVALPAPASEPGMRSLRVLVADDSRIDRTLGLRLLEKRGHSVLAVASGEEAITAVARESFDLVLMDVQMPGLGGLEATREIRRGERISGRHLPIVALTAHEMKGLCLEAGMDAYLHKPVDVHELVDVLRRVVPASSAAAGERLDEDGPLRPLDEEVALERAGGDRALLVDLAEMCLCDGPAAVDRIRDGLRTRDAKAVESAAHQLKGSLLVLAADPASEAAHRLEALGAQGALDQAAAALAALERELERLRPALARLAASRSPVLRVSNRGDGVSAGVDGHGQPGPAPSARSAPVASE